MWSVNTTQVENDNEKIGENRKHINGSDAPGRRGDFLRRSQEFHEPGRFQAACNDGADNLHRQPQPYAQGQERKDADNTAHGPLDDYRAQERRQG